MTIAKHGLASGYQEVMTYWDIDDVVAAAEVLDILDDAEAAEYEKAKRARK